MKEEDLRRIERLLERDKEEMNAESRKAALAEFSRVAEEFFELSSAPDLNVTRERKGFFVTFTVKASRVKNFTSFGQ